MMAGCRPADVVSDSDVRNFSTQVKIFLANAQTTTSEASLLNVISKEREQETPNIRQRFRKD